MNNQYKESVITTSKNKTINKVSKTMENIYQYVIKKFKNSEDFKDCLKITKGVFLDYSDDDRFMVKIKLFDGYETETIALNINPTLNFSKNQTLFLGYYNDYKNLIVLGLAEKGRL